MFSRFARNTGSRPARLWSTLAVLAVSVGLLAVPGMAAAAPTTIDTISGWNGQEDVGNFGPSGSLTDGFGQTIVAPAGTSTLDSFAFEMNLPASVVFRGQVYAWDGANAVGPALYESAPRSTTGSGAFELVTFETGGVPVTPGAYYLILATASKDAGSGNGIWGYRSSDPYADGGFAYQYAAEYVAAYGYPAGWTYAGNADLAFTAAFDQNPLTAAPDPTSFGTQPEGTIGAARTITVTSEADGQLIGRPRISGTDADDFFITRDNCDGVTLDTGNTCTVNVRFAPSAPGARNATLTVPGTDGDATAALEGTGGSAAQGPTGPAGTTGETGSSGPTGQTGETGPTGPAGSDGLGGATGPAGSDGQDGTDGTDGTNGTNGTAGPAGPAGPAGANGAPGAPGPQGPAGPTSTRRPFATISQRCSAVAATCRLVARLPRGYRMLSATVRRNGTTLIAKSRSRAGVLLDARGNPLRVAAGTYKVRLRVARGSAQRLTRVMSTTVPV